MKYLAFFIVAVVIVIGGYSIFAPKHFSVDGDLMVTDLETCNLNIVVYSTPTCPYCVDAKRLLRAQNLDFREINLMNEPEEARKLQARTSSTSVPQIFINNKHLGGFTELSQWLKSSEYKNFLKTCSTNVSD